MREVWKYDLEVADAVQEITMPQGAIIVHTDLQNFKPTMWVLVEPQNKPVMRVFVIHGTGHPILDCEKYVGTVMAPPYVWHICEVESR
jgi:hypothetical protein